MDTDLEYVYNCESFQANFDEIENPSWSHDWDHMIQRLCIGMISSLIPVKV